ncbi:MAG: hypothetical protein LIO96_00560 [Lachnospiraceae bacterium]|nr:hypothetical protein [Lachnospiraceae bacterium]
MYWNELNLEGAPERGQMLLYTRRSVLFRTYEDKAEIADNLADQELLEVHLFDRKKEYRAIATRSPRFPQGMIETVADFPENEESAVYRELVLLEKGKGVITVLNHIAYDKNGMASVDNYRLTMGGACDE